MRDISVAGMLTPAGQGLFDETVPLFGRNDISLCGKRQSDEDERGTIVTTGVDMGFPVAPAAVLKRICQVFSG